MNKFTSLALTISLVFFNYSPSLSKAKAKRKAPKSIVASSDYSKGKRDKFIQSLDGYSHELLEDIISNNDAKSTLILFDVDRTLIYRTPGKKHLCQPIVPEFVSTLSKNFTTLGLTFLDTARTNPFRWLITPWYKIGTKNIINRDAELKDLAINFSEYDLERDDYSSDKIFVINNANGCEYYKGIIATNGMDKGLALLEFLNQNPNLKKRIKKIIFFDDKDHYIESVQKACDNLSLNYNIYKYKMPVELGFVSSVINP